MENENKRFFVKSGNEKNGNLKEAATLAELIYKNGKDNTEGFTVWADFPIYDTTTGERIW